MGREPGWTIVDRLYVCVTDAGSDRFEVRADPHVAKDSCGRIADDAQILASSGVSQF